ncbi:hypothetical protein BDY19DRAFT_626554 [Irpex rosettiformis]|uniref:Uncharacterized protein n=1 Tax=Irpex rosettiformis TaxID=378272 RepID=A0ACB8UBU0_9APHY|nr:hypothetical protein BDY19DRAFT_626554 [Irpex rosettiformis]
MFAASSSCQPGIFLLVILCHCFKSLSASSSLISHAPDQKKITSRLPTPRNPTRPDANRTRAKRRASRDHDSNAFRRTDGACAVCAPCRGAFFYLVERRRSSASSLGSHPELIMHLLLQPSCVLLRNLHQPVYPFAHIPPSSHSHLLFIDCTLCHKNIDIYTHPYIFPCSSYASIKTDNAWLPHVRVQVRFPTLEFRFQSCACILNSDHSRY